ncbi:hypothetical protein OHB12_07925 [Nocardia sp. NBC_01730]|uniref:hypothetical protein n=1 Tax=Nocardia sp. NBC_01730 TaxID=2975998 RepID=UPI002E15DA4D|nr:hypothetical protein OHB12_07925 [Nocardia sp. NBC_01730]
MDVTIEGIPADVPSWREIEGTEVESTESGEPIEASVYDGAHHFFEYARIQILRQVGTMARFAVDLAEGEAFFHTLPHDEILEADQIRTTVDAEFEPSVSARGGLACGLAGRLVPVLQTGRDS